MDELVKDLRLCVDGQSCDECSKWTIKQNSGLAMCTTVLCAEAADAIEELRKAILRLEDESGILDELPMVDQSTRCDTCVHKGNVDFDYCHICNNEADMYKPQPPKEE